MEGIVTGIIHLRVAIAAVRDLTQAANAPTLFVAGEIDAIRLLVQWQAAPAPKEQPPRKLSGKRTADTSNTLESGAKALPPTV
jgi:hypothetical protein